MQWIFSVNGTPNTETNCVKREDAASLAFPFSSIPISRMTGPVHFSYMKSLRARQNLTDALIPMIKANTFHVGMGTDYVFQRKMFPGGTHNSIHVICSGFLELGEL